MNVQDFIAKKRRGERISMVTCYDAWSARLIAGTAIDCGGWRGHEIVVVSSGAISRWASAHREIESASTATR